MKRIVLLLFIILFACELKAQDSIRSTKWSIGLAASLDFSYRFVASTQKTIQVNGAPYHYEDQIPKGGIHLALSAGYKVCKYFEIKSGFNFYYNGYNTKSFYIIQYGRDHDIVGIDTIQQKYSYYYLGVPFWLNGNINCSKKISVVFGAGITINCFTKCKATPFDWGTYTEIDGFNSTIMAKVGINYIIDNHLSLDIAPNFNYFATPLRDDNAIDGANKELYLYSAGIEFGLNYNFSRRMK